VTESLGSYLNGPLYSLAVSKEMFVDHSFTWKHVPCRVGLQESTSMEMCLLACSLAKGPLSQYYNVQYCNCICCFIGDKTFFCHKGREQMRVFVIKVPRRIFGPEGHKATGEWTRLHAWGFVICTHHQILLEPSNLGG
jgi:hypothetical protein